MNDSNQLLSLTIENAKMGLSGIEHLLKISKDDPFRKTLGNQYANYNSFVQEGADLLRSRGEEVPDLSIPAKVGSYLSTEMNAALDRTTSQLAEMMVQGTTMGIVKLIRKARSLDMADEGSKDFAARLIDYEEKCVEEMKAFL